VVACIRVTGWNEGVEPSPALVLDVAQQFSPRVTWAGGDAVLVSLDGLERLFGDARTIGEELRRALADRGIQARLAVAGTAIAAQLLTLARAGLTVVAPGGETVALATLPIQVLAEAVAALPPPDDTPRPPSRFYRTSPVEELVRRRRRPSIPNPHSDPRSTTPDPRSPIPDLFRRWGLRTLGDLAALPADELSARLGAQGPIWQAMARGEDAGPFVPLVPDERFEQSLALEWPIEGLEPLSFVLGRLFDPLCAHLDRRGRAAAVVVVDLRLVTREVWTRQLTLPAPLKDPRVLRTLVLLDLESHPPPAGIDAVTIRADPAPARTLQGSLLERARPAPEQITTLVARLKALMGETRVGRPVVVDSHRPGAFRMEAFTGDAVPGGEPPGLQVDGPPSPEEVSLRRFRMPVAARVTAEAGRPVHLRVHHPGIADGRIVTSAGPWRTSGDWWLRGADAGAWDRDEWDVALQNGTVCRMFRDRLRDCWFVDAIYD
jgi:protein ImuB